MEEGRSEVAREEDGAGEASSHAVPGSEWREDGAQRGPDWTSGLVGSLHTTGQLEVRGEPGVREMSFHHYQLVENY